MTEKKIKEYFAKSSIELNDKQLKQFVLYYNLIIENNDDNDLTRIKGEDQFIIKHFIDSVYYTKFFQLPGSLIDIGTGAGFPGIPIKIMNPSVNLILAEQRKRRVDFLKLAIDKLKLTDTYVYPHKVTDKSFFNVDGVITRALEDIADTLDRVEHFLPQSGLVIFLKGPDASKDILAMTENNKKNYELKLDQEYTLPETNFSRRILIFKKRGTTFRKIYKIMKDTKDTNETKAINEKKAIIVTSDENKFYKDLKRALNGDNIKKHGVCTIAGKRIISDYIKKWGYDETKLILPDDYSETSKDFDAIINEFSSTGRLYIFKKSLFNELDLQAGKIPILIATIPKIKEWDYKIEDGCTPVLPFQDPVNIGSAVRSAVGFGISKIILTSDAANPFHPKSIRSSSGGVFEIEFFRGPALNDILPIIEKNNIEIIALDKKGRDIFDIDIPAKFLLIPGLEGRGLPMNYLPKSVSIKISDKIESLNASVALSIFMYEYNKKFKLT
ncbi:MAG: 16S rRNA (guanine(527)-N(7))-methyltransferase RsmG [Leptospirales bacterium]|nr:16S rRNA (guanine(527)-N(7))-methyltransferase RsmG [Leptospirales bacterium]